MSVESPPPEGQVIDYSTMTPMPLITYNSSNNTMVFSNPIQAENQVSTTQNNNLLNQINLKAPLDNPVFTGTITSPIINANTSFQVNGVDINTMYAPAAPALDSYALESDVSSLYATKTSVNTKAPLDNPEFTGTAVAPTINATTALQINGTNTNNLYQQRAYITAVIPVGTTGQAVSGVSWSGAATSFTVNKTATGTYVFNWTPSIPSTYVFFGNLRNAAGFVSFNGAGGATLNCLSYNATGTQVDVSSGFHVMIFRNP